MKATLVVANGPSTGKSVAVTAWPFWIGRARDCHLRPSSQLVSNRHCYLFVRDRIIFVRDPGSTNGTFVNDVRLTGDTELRHGDQLRTGPLLFHVQVEGDTPSAVPRVVQMPQPAGVIDSPEAILLDPGEAAPDAVLDSEDVSGQTQRIVPPANLCPTPKPEPRPPEEPM